MENISNTRFDLCVVGAGPAGIILALEYSKLNPGKSVVLVEFGRRNTQKNSLDDSIQITNLRNHHSPYECTNKGIGGSSATWGGRCVMYDEVDFIDRPIINNGCTWDLSLLKEADKFVKDTTDYFECGDSGFNLDANPLFKGTNIAEGFVSGDVTDSVVERWSMPTRFGSRYLNEIKSRKNIFLLEGFQARDFQVDAAGKVHKLSVRDIDSMVEQEILADKFVLAAGTQETTRILLRNSQLFQALPVIPAALGKYYQGHVSGKIASVKFNGDPEKTDYGFLRDKDGVYIRRRFQFSTDYLVKNNLLNTAIWLDNPLYHDPRHKSGAMSFMYLAMITPILGKKLAPPAIAESITKGRTEKVSEHLLNVLKDFPGSLIKPATVFYKRYLLKRKLPGVFLYSPDNKYALHFHAEQIPEKTNQMRLADDGETLIIDYRLLEEDVRSVIELHRKLDESLRKSGCGELEYWFSQDELPSAIHKMSRDGIHQSGTTRIAKSPQEGVVDEDLKVFGTQNVYVCSSSVFPTSGQANPTFFLGVFAVRLARHL